MQISEQRQQHELNVTTAMVIGAWTWITCRQRQRQRRRLLSLNISPFARTVIIIFVFDVDARCSRMECASGCSSTRAFNRFSRFFRSSFRFCASGGNERAHVHNIISIVRTETIRTHTRTIHMDVGWTNVDDGKSEQHFPSPKPTISRQLLLRQVIKCSQNDDLVVV